MSLSAVVQGIKQNLIDWHINSSNHLLLRGIFTAIAADFLVGVGSVTEIVWHWRPHSHDVIFIVLTNTEENIRRTRFNNKLRTHRKSDCRKLTKDKLLIRFSSSHISHSSC